jgi:hypothetical protein
MPPKVAVEVKKLVTADLIICVFEAHGNIELEVMLTQSYSINSPLVVVSWTTT